MMDYFKTNCIDNPIVINTIGILDPNRPKAQIERVNVTFPLTLLETIYEIQGTLVTFGTILEEFPNLCNQNAYLASKLKLSRALIAECTEISPRYIHFRMHTWYGGQNLHPHMFLGQIVESINLEREFRMSSGNQIREYHHIDDDINGILLTLKNGGSGILPISHGDSRPLREIAERVFSHFDKLPLLQFDCQKESLFENFNTRYEPLNLDLSFAYRPLFPAITNYLERFVWSGQK